MEKAQLEVKEMLFQLDFNIHPQMMLSEQL